MIIQLQELTCKPIGGFSALVEAKERKILFDTSANGRILLSNMQKLKINPKEIKDIFYFSSSLGSYRRSFIFSWSE